MRLARELADRAQLVISAESVAAAAKMIAQRGNFDLTNRFEQGRGIADRRDRIQLAHA